MILTIRTDNPETEIGLFINEKKIDYLKWRSDRELSNQLHCKIAEMLESQKSGWHDITGIIFFEGPGSFTGLRIGASLVNSLASELDIPVVQSSGKEWIEIGVEKISKGTLTRAIVPNYGRPPRITKPTK